MLQVIALGFGSGLALIVAIGAQNAFVLRQGILRQHVLPVALICALSDAILQVLGIAGVGFVIDRAPIVLDIVLWGGVAFLLWYAWLAARRAMRPEVLIAQQSESVSLKKTIIACLMITYLNPHVYLDTMVLMGSIGNTQGDAKWLFALGGVLASFAWFFTIAFGARALSRFFATPKSWQVLEWIVAAIMLLVAVRLATSAL